MRAVLQGIYNVRFQCAISMRIYTAHQNTRFATFRVIDHIFCCTSKMRVIAADRVDAHLNCASKPVANVIDF
jgi:hypothetical protein